MSKDRRDDDKVYTPEGPDRRQTARRSGERAQVSLWAVEATDEATYYHNVREISTSGLFFEKQLPLPVDTKVRLEINISDDEVLRATGTVVRAAELGSDIGNGVRFDELSPEDFAKIQQLVAKGKS